jgi:hypothetical protein
MAQINIFWIEDNPIQDDFVEVDGVKYPSFRITKHEGLFVFKLFQHPMEVREYLSMVYSLRRAGLSNKLADRCPGAIPDVVVFDYKLSDNFNTSNPSALQYNRPNQRSFIQKHSAAFRLKETFPEQFKDRVLFNENDAVIEGNYDSDEFRKALEIDNLPLDDEFGLFAGISVVREFKDHITLGIPATFNKTDKSAMSSSALFFEWLNSYDIEDAIKRPEKGNKNWDDIAEFALPLLRIRIGQQIQSRQVTASYQQLLDISNGSQRDNLLRLTSAYGERLLPLDGLFLGDEHEMQIWASKLIALLPLAQTEVERARRISETLWHTFTSDFDDRILLSDYANRTEPLSKAEEAAFEEIKLNLCDPTGSKIAPECSIQTLAQNENEPTVRLAVLLLVTKAAIELQKCREFGPSREEYVDLSSYDFFNLLFPKVNLRNQLVLPMHADTGSKRNALIDTPRKWLFRSLTMEASEVSEANWFKFDEWITLGEKALVRSIYYEERQYYPTWLL